MLSKQTDLNKKNQRELARLKFTLLADGMRISEGAQRKMEDSKHPIRTRSGASGGLDMELPHDVHVNVAVNEQFTKDSPLELVCLEESFYIKKDEELLAHVELQPTPMYYSEFTSDGSKKMIHIGQMCSGDRFCYGMTGPGCYFWGRSNRCQYCSIGDNYNDDARNKQERHLLEVLDRAINDPNLPAKHVLLGGGTPPGDDMGAVLAAPLCKLIKEQYDISIYVMIAAPLTNGYIDLLFDSGIDELGMNIEFWGDEAWRNYIPGKNRIIGKKRYLDALEYAVSKFGPINTRSLIIAGLEEKNLTIEGAVELAQMGVMPIISPFRPLDNTILQDSGGFSGGEYLEIFEEIKGRTKDFDIPIGPTCKHCQNNVLATPFGDHFYYY